MHRPRPWGWHAMPRAGLAELPAVSVGVASAGVAPGAGALAQAQSLTVEIWNGARLVGRVPRNVSLS